MQLGVPQILLLAIVLSGLFAAISLHGKPRSPLDARVTLVGVLIELGLLYWGGFFG